jgi:small-conductance mechanosensitive channel
MEKFTEFLNYTFQITENVKISIKSILIIIVVFILTAIVLRLIRLAVTRKIREQDVGKFITVFSFAKYFIFAIIFLVILGNNGVQLTAVFTSAAALLIGIGLALQTFFQDIISGIFILTDQSVNVGDVIQVEDKIGKVTSINLRTTKAVTIENKVLIIPNHMYLTNTLFNWTQNGATTREFVKVGVAYGSDVDLVKKVLLKAAHAIEGINESPEPLVLFDDYADSSLNFKIVVSIGNSFYAPIIMSQLRFEINKQFKAHKITIPFPQRDVHLYPTTD